MSELWRWDAVELAAAIRLRKISSRDAVAACLARIEAVNPRLNAVVRVLAESAVRQADAADAAVKRGDALGALHGVPVTIKENIDQTGLATVNGVEAFLKTIASVDAPPVANWKKAGAIVIGRTNTPAFSSRWTTDNAVRGRTQNPWSRAHVPGGSSGGAAAAVAAGMGPLAHGNDYAGSIRYPAYCCGVAGLRPSFGRVPAWNASAPAERPPTAQLMSVQGPLARRVRDLRIGLAAMAARDLRDPWWVPAPLEGPAPARPIRVALLPSPPGLEVDREVAQAVRDAGRALAEAGYAVEEVAPPPVAEVAELAFRLVAQDMRTFSMQQVRELADPEGRRSLELFVEGVAPMSEKDYAAGIAERARHLRAWLAFLEATPLVLLPVSGRLPFVHGFDTGNAETFRAAQLAQSTLIAFNLLGLPGVSVPVGTVADAQAPRGLPVGVQLVASRFREDLALDAAEAIEARHPMPTPIDPVA